MPVLWLTVCFMAVATMSFHTANNRADEPGTNLWLIGTVNGKSFFAQREPLLTWFEARDYCESMGMKFAKIETQEEANFLAAAATDLEHFMHAHWVSGRDSHAYHQVSWDDTNETVDRFAFVNGVVTTDIEYLTCFAFHPYSNGATHGDLFPCTQKEGVLCQTS